MKQYETEQYTTLDITTQGLIVIDFLAFYAAAMEGKLENITDNTGIRDFYSWFSNQIGNQNSRQGNFLFTPAAILGYLYVAFLLPQQDFYNKIPQKRIRKTEWGIEAEDLRYLCKKIRNSLAHNDFIICKNMKFVFKDSRNKSVISEFYLEELYRFTKKFLVDIIIPNMTNRTC